MATPPTYRYILDDVADYAHDILLCEGLPDLPASHSQLIGCDMNAEIAKARLSHHPALCTLLEHFEDTPEQAPHRFFQDLASKPLTLAFTQQVNAEIILAPYAVVAAHFGFLTIPAPQFISHRSGRDTLYISAPQDGTAITWGVPLALLSGIRTATPHYLTQLTRLHTGRTRDNNSQQEGTILHLKGNGLILSGAPIESFITPARQTAQRHRLQLPASFFPT